MQQYNIAVLSGDGIGPEIMAQAIKVLNAVQQKFDFKLNYNYFDMNLNHFINYKSSKKSDWGVNFSSFWLSDLKYMYRLFRFRKEETNTFNVAKQRAGYL